MKILTPTREELSSELAPTFDALQKEFGFVPNLALMIGCAPNALNAFLTLNASQTKGAFSKAEVEIIQLAVSEYHGSPYCIAAHSKFARDAGLSEAETHAARHVSLADARQNFLADFARRLVINRGQMTRQELDDFEEMGFDAQNLMGLIAIVVEAIWTNFVGLTTKIQPDIV